MHIPACCCSLCVYILCRHSYHVCLQDHKETNIADHQETVEVCRQLVMEILDFKDIDEILPRAKRKHAKKCFICFDADASGELDGEEFAVLMNLIDPSLDAEGVQQMFQESAHQDLMEFREFCVWCANTFGADGDTDQFATDMNELILKVAQPQTQRGNEHPADMSDTKIDWATRLFSAFDADDSGSLELGEFFELMQSVDPDIEPGVLKVQFEELGAFDGMMNLSQFLEWANRMFGTNSTDEDFMKDMKELITIGKSHHAARAAEEAA